jgi:ribosomal protein L29
MSEVEKVLKLHSERKPDELRLAAQLSEGSPGMALEMDVEATVEKSKVALRILEKSAKTQGFSVLFADTSALSKDRESSFEELLALFYSLLTDLLELTAKANSPALRNPHLTSELKALASTVDTNWVNRAIAEVDNLAAGVRRNLSRQLGLDSLAASLSSAAPPRTIAPRL